MTNKYVDQCPIWRTPAVLSDKSDLGELSTIISPRAGGGYTVDEQGMYWLLNKNVQFRAKVNLSKWISIQQELGIESPIVSVDLIKEFENQPLRNVVERLDDAMRWFGRKQTSIATRLEIQNSSWVGSDLADPKGFLFFDFLAATNCANVDEGEKLLDFLQERKFIHRINGTSLFSVTPEGWVEVARHSTETQLGEQAFVAMWFDSMMDTAFIDGFKKGVEDVGYRALRIDNKEHNNKIDDEILAEIRRSKFIVADFTSDILRRGEKSPFDFDLAIARGGVYFEAGFAKGLGKEVIWTVREDVLPLVHFDTRQFAHIVWKNPADLRSRLAKRIAATLDYGPLKKSTR